MSSSEHRKRGARLSGLGLSAVASIWALAGCGPLGARQLPIDRFDYSQAIARSANEQMLTNVVRLRYSEPPVFLTVNSVLTQYIYSGSVGASGTTGEAAGASSWSVGGSANLLYIERPTITYTPLAGQQFAAQLIAPVPTDLVFGLVESGWPADLLLAMTLQRINDVENVSFARREPAEEQRRLRRFDEVVRMLIELARREAIQMETAEGDVRYLVFRERAEAETQALIGQLKDAVGLARDRSRFRVTTRIIGRGPDEVTVRIRSILELMGFLARGVEIPPEHIEQDRVVSAAVTGEATAAVAPLRISSQADRPADAFVAVRHAGYWFYIPHSDHESKQAFAMLTYLFQMQAPQLQGAGPLLTVPTG